MEPTTAIGIQNALRFGPYSFNSGGQVDKSQKNYLTNLYRDGSTVQKCVNLLVLIYCNLFFTKFQTRTGKRSLNLAVNTNFFINEQSRSSQRFIGCRDILLLSTFYHYAI